MPDLVRPRPISLDRGFRGPEAITLNILYVVQVRSVAMETNPLHALVAFTFFALLGFIQIRYPQNPTPFQLHPKTTMLSIATFLLYCLGFLGTLMFPIRVHHFDTLMHVFGSLSLISLLLLLLPETWDSLGFVVYKLWFITLLLFIVIKTRLREILLQRQQIRRVVRPLLPTTSWDFNYNGDIY
ncbi:hypothetical protein DEO72_LG8g699 [Vigna unguiculata]|uniref:Uncharacterized protein n=1 Tax=Vigna unguiculata TaxID=3917 RepID=A0A4D6MPI0_VIGUN|nr:hypothetical protein DEO72_LG8g699 [Vigna unguiculata]